MEHQPKPNEKYTPFLQCMSSFEGTFRKIYKIQPSSSFISYFFTIFFISADIIFPNFLERHSTLSKKIIIDDS